MKTLAKSISFTACLAVCTLVLAGCAAGGDRTVIVPEGGATPTITVTANSEVKVVPDKAEVGVAVTTQAATAEGTQSENTTNVNAVIDALKKLGVDEKSIQTTDTYLNPRYDYSSPITYSAPAASNGEELAIAAEDSADDSSTNIVGYEMTTRLAVSDLDIGQVGEVVSACVEAGANNTDGIRDYSSDYDAKYNEALTAAVEEARQKADVLAKASGATLGNVYSMTEGYQNTSYRYDSASTMEATSADGAMKVMPGELEVTASVTVSYEIL